MVEKVVFLDIDGVLQPFTQYRFDHIQNGDMEKVYEELHQKTGVDYRKYDIYDVAAVYYDWDMNAVSELKRVLDTSGAKIVLSSSWRDETHERMRDLFRIHDLESYFVDGIEFLEFEKDISLYLITLKLGDDMKYQTRSVEILLYLHEHLGIKRYVAIDDMRLEGLGEHFIKTTYKLTPELADRCIEVLTNVATLPQ
ncbi:MAG: HAD domain-containing protein [Oscillospiraceae bacterium]|nr:HAD domain-containing protein [Oscillospiraceae bacterium]